MENMAEFLRVIEGALKGNPLKVVTYSEKIAEKLRNCGKVSSAKRIEKILEKNRNSPVSLSSAATRLPVDGDSRISLADEEIINLEDSFMAVPANISEKVDTFVNCLVHQDRLINAGLDIAPSMIIYGPPGVGKTLLVKNVAAKLGLPLITARSDALVSSFLGSTAKNIRNLFDHVKNRPCVLFLDELDSIAKVRDDVNELGELKRVVISLLQNIDALGNETILMAATNHEHLLDPAIWRRFTYKLSIELPNQESRKALFQRFLPNFTPKSFSSKSYLGVSKGLTGADMKLSCEAVKRKAVLSNNDKFCEVALVRELIITRLQKDISFKEAEKSCIKMVRELGCFNGVELALIFDMSRSTISRRLSEGVEA